MSRDSDVGREMDLYVMYCNLLASSVEGIRDDVMGVVLKVREARRSLSVMEATNRVLDYIRSSSEIRSSAMGVKRRSQFDNLSREGVFRYHFFAFKEKQRSLAFESSSEYSRSSMSWSVGQMKLAKIILDDSYDKVENPGPRLE